MTFCCDQWFAKDRPVSRGQIDPCRSQLANARSMITRYITISR